MKRPSAKSYKQLNSRLDPLLYDWLAETAATNNISVREMLEIIIAEAKERQEVATGK